MAQPNISGIVTFLFRCSFRINASPSITLSVFFSRIQIIVPSTSLSGWGELLVRAVSHLHNVNQKLCLYHKQIKYFSFLNLSQYILKHIYIILSLDFENSQCSHLCPIVPTLLPMGHVTEVVLSPPQGLATGSEGDLYHLFWTGSNVINRINQKKATDKQNKHTDFSII